MTRSTTRPGRRRPWLIGGVCLLYHVFAVYDFVAAQLQGEAYMRAMGMTSSQIAYFTSLPPWVSLAWAVSVWGGLAASMAWLAARGPAAGLFLVATAGTAAYVVWSFLLSDGVEAMGAMWFMPLVVGAATLAIAIHTRTVSKAASETAPS